MYIIGAINKGKNVFGICPGCNHVNGLPITQNTEIMKKCRGCGKKMLNPAVMLTNKLMRLQWHSDSEIPPITIKC